MPTLYELSAEARAIDAAIEDADGELTPEIEAALDALSSDLEDKVTAIVGLVRDMEARADARRSEADRLAASAKRVARQADRLKDYLTRCLDLAGRDRMETRLGRIAVRLNPPSVAIAAGAEVPRDLTRETVQRVPDKTAIKAAIESGRDVPGCSIVRTTRLEIK